MWVLLALLMVVHADDDLPYNAAELNTWKSFFKNSSGESWKHCSGSFSDPCGECNSADDDDRYVHCSEIGEERRIENIVLFDNNLDGVADINSMTSTLQALTLFNLTKNPKLLGTGPNGELVYF